MKDECCHGHPDNGDLALQTESQREETDLRAINAALLEALERTVDDLEDVLRIVRVDKGIRGEWPRAETGLIQARAAIKAAKGDA